MMFIGTKNLLNCVVRRELMQAPVEIVLQSMR